VAEAVDIHDATAAAEIAILADERLRLISEAREEGVSVSSGSRSPT